MDNNIDDNYGNVLCIYIQYVGEKYNVCMCPCACVCISITCIVKPKI